MSHKLDKRRNQILYLKRETFFGSRDFSSWASLARSRAGVLILFATDSVRSTRDVLLIRSNNNTQDLRKSLGDYNETRKEIWKRKKETSRSFSRKSRLFFPSFFHGSTVNAPRKSVLELRTSFTRNFDKCANEKTLEWWMSWAFHLCADSWFFATRQSGCSRRGSSESWLRKDIERIY